MFLRHPAKRPRRALRYRVGMFERYTEPARRAIFFARTVTISSDRSLIDPVDLLRGLIFEDNRAQVIFNLREFFPVYRGCPAKNPDLRNPRINPPLDENAKQVLRETAAEANRMGDFWIDTEHVLLGILRVQNCDAARYLAMIGVTLSSARETIEQNKPSRPNYGPLPLSWRVKRRLKRLLQP